MSREELFTDQPHRRFNPLNGSWVLCSPHRAKRPWLGQVEKIVNDHIPTFDEKCYLCPGNTRASGEKNEKYTSTYVFTNDYSALLPEKVEDIEKFNEEDLIIAQPQRGICKVIIFSPDHSKTLPLMSEEEIEIVIKTWVNESLIIAKHDFISYIQIFENKGAVMGCSNPHPHCQIWATEEIPHEVSLEMQSFKSWKEKKGTCLLCNCVELEVKKSIRVLSLNESFAIVVPFWAVWPFETMIIPLKHVSSLNDLDSRQIQDLSASIKELTTRYDNIFNCSFPYSMGIHQSPCNKQCKDFHFHMHFYPPLLRSSTVKKFFVGFEMLAEAQRDITPEKATVILQDCPVTHFSLN